jgi:hypothetical protein
VSRDPLYDDRHEEERLADSNTVRLLTRVQWLKLLTGAVALALIAAIWVTWRWG